MKRSCPKAFILGFMFSLQWSSLLEESIEINSFVIIFLYVDPLLLFGVLKVDPTLYILW